MSTSAGKAAVVTISDGVMHGTRTDASGDLAETMVRDAGFEIAERLVVPDERPEIEAVLRRLADDAGIGLVVTTGGTGFGPRDVTPEATRAVIDREAPGLAELMRSAGLARTPMAALSRAVVGSRGPTLIVNLPGSQKGVGESLGAIVPVVRHAVELLAGSTGAHPTGHGDANPAALAPGSSAGPWVEVKAIRVEGSPPCIVGNAMQIQPGGEVHGTLGCAEFDDAAVRDAAEVLAVGSPSTRMYEHEHGSVEVYLEPHAPASFLVVVSATDVARALRAHASALGSTSVLVEPRTERLSAQDRALPAASALDELALDDRAEIVFTDHDMPGLTGMIASALRSPARFIGVMGSRRHVGPYLQELKEMGFDDDELARVRSPVGLDLGGQRPEEVALAIAAGLVAARHDRGGGWLDR